MVQRRICVWILAIASALLLVFMLTPSSPVRRHGAQYVLYVPGLSSHLLHSPLKGENVTENLTQTVNAKQSEKCQSLRYAYRKIRVQGRNEGSLPNPLSLADDYLDAEVFGDVDVFLDTVPDDQKYVVLVIADSFYRNITINWMCVLHRTSLHMLNHLLVLSMDRELHEYLESKGISSVFTPPERLLNMTIVKCSNKRFGHVWMTRILMVHYILKQGVDVFVIDTDAFPIKDPLHMINTIALAEKVDAIFGRGTYPSVAKRSWGFTLCFGTAYFRSTAGTMHLLEAMGQLDPFNSDDQVRLNVAIKTVTGVDWRVRSTYGVTVGSSRSTTLPFRVAVLPYSVVCRSTCRKLLHNTNADLQDLHIMHALIPKGTNKKSHLANLGYWLLDEQKLGRGSGNAEAWLTDVCTG